MMGLVALKPPLVCISAGGAFHALMRSLDETNYQIFITAGSSSIQGVASGRCYRRGGGGGGGGAVQDRDLDGEAGTAGSASTGDLRLKGDAVAYSVGDAGAGGSRNDAVSAYIEAGDGEGGAPTTVSGFPSVSGGAGGRGAVWDFGAGTSYDRSAASVSNPDGSPRGRGGFGGDASSGLLNQRDGSDGNDGLIGMAVID